MRGSNRIQAQFYPRIWHFWESLPLLTSAMVLFYGCIYLACLLIGYDNFFQICFLPSAITSRLEVHRIFTSVAFHASILHLVMNMLALLPLGSELERIMGSIRLLYTIILVITSNGVFHLLFAMLVAHNPFHPYWGLMEECSIGFSGVLFSMIVMETTLSGVTSRSVLGLFDVPANWYAFALLVVFQLLVPNVSFLGHLCGILSGFAYVNGCFNMFMPAPSFFSAIEASPCLSSCVGRSKFISCTGVSLGDYIATPRAPHSAPIRNLSQNIWASLCSWIPSRETSAQSEQDSRRFPGLARTVGSGQTQVDSDASLQARLLDASPPGQGHASNVGAAALILNGSASDNMAVAAPGESTQHEGSPLLTRTEQIQKLVSMGFDMTQVEVVLAAADGDPNVALEILVTQQQV